MSLSQSFQNGSFLTVFKTSDDTYLYIYILHIQGRLWVQFNWSSKLPYIFRGDYEFNSIDLQNFHIRETNQIPL